MILRDYYLFYRKSDNTDKDKKLKWSTYEFWCQKGKEQFICYRIGILCQCLIKYHKPSDITESTHITSENYLQEIKIEHE